MKRKLVIISLLSILFLPTVKADDTEIDVETPCIGCGTSTYIFETNGGTSINSCTLTTASPSCLDSNNNVVVPSTGVLPTPTKEGYTFAGWYDEAEFTTQVSKLSEVTVDVVNGYVSESTIYAKWDKNTVVNKTDAATNVSVQISTSTSAQDIQLNVSNIVESSSEYTKITSLIEASKYQIFDIELVQQNTVIQSTGEIIITFNLPEGFNSSKTVVYGVSDDNKVTELSYTISSGKLEVETEQYSYYVIAEVDTQISTSIETSTTIESTVETTTEEIIEEEQVENPDTVDNIVYTVGLALIVIAMIIAIYVKLNKKVRA